MWLTLAEAGLGLILKIGNMIADAKSAKTQAHGVILAAFTAADAALDKAAEDARASVDDETKQTEDAIKAATEAASAPAPAAATDVGPVVVKTGIEPSKP